MLHYKLILLNLLLSIFGLLVAGSVLFSFLKYHWGRLKIQEKMGSFVLVLFSFLWPFLAIPIYLSVLINGQFLGGWPQYVGIVILTVVAGALTGHILLALERYYIVLHNQKLTTARIVTCFCIIYGYSAVTLIIQLGFAPYGFIPMEGGTWCYIDLTSSHPIQRANNILVVLYCVGAVNFISYAYFSVYYKTREVVKMRRPSSHRTMTALEKRVFHRCLLITASFITSFTPTFIGVFYRFFSGNRISAELDYATSIFALLDSIVTPILVCYMQSDFREAMMAYLPSEWRLYLQAYFEKEAAALRSQDTKASQPTSHTTSSVPHTQFEPSEKS